MHSSNLSKLVTHEYFFELLEQEKIHFDWIISERKIDRQQDNLLFLERPIGELIQEYKIKKTDSILVILDQLTVSFVLKELEIFENVKILNAFDGISSIGYKVSCELWAYYPLLKSGFDLLFPFDENQFFTGLSKAGKKYFSLINQEIADSIYTLGAEEDELVFIDKALAEQPAMISLINNPDAEHHILMMGNYFEEAVKLSQYLLEKPQAYHLTLLWQTSLLHSEQLKNQIKKMKKLTIILDQFPDSDLKNFFAQELGLSHELITFITPDYDQIRSVFSEYQLSESAFDAENLSERIG